MILTKKSVFLFLLLFTIVSDMLEIIHYNYLGISTIFSCCSYLVLPGLLLSFILRVSRISFWENLLLIIGFSLAFLEFGGLLLNILLPLFGRKDPLSYWPMVIWFDAWSFVLLLLAWLRTRPFAVPLNPLHRTKLEKCLYFLPPFFPFLAMLGAIVLNNGGPNGLALALLPCIGLYVFLLVLLRNRIAVDLFPYTIFFIALACLFTTSLRGWYITGHDIQIEYYVFELTEYHRMWSMSYFPSPYSACLSLTILPTILTNVLFIPDAYIYKVLYQILFATSPVMIFFLLRNYTSAIFAFLSAFLFISFPTFFNDMPMLNRQEIGFIFFGLALYMMLHRPQLRRSLVNIDTIPLIAIPTRVSEVGTLTLPALSKQTSQPAQAHPADLSLPMRRSLFVFFSSCVIVSHYSTNFILLGLVVFVYLLTRFFTFPWIYKVLQKKIGRSRLKPKNAFPNNGFLNIVLVTLLLGSTYLWNSIYTQSSSSQAGSVISEVIAGLFISTSADKRSNDLADSLFFATKADPQKELQNYIASVSQKLASKGSTSDQYYSKAITNLYPSKSSPQTLLPETPFGALLTSLHIPVFSLQSGLRLLSAYFMQIFVFIGFFALLFAKNKKPYDLQYLLLCVASLLLLGLITILPALSVEYGVLRMFQQFLYVLSLPILLGLDSILFFLREKKRMVVIGAILVFLFLNLTGFISHLTGDYYPQLPVDNGGLYYDAYYVHGTDVYAIIWLSQTDRDGRPVEADLSGLNKLLMYANISATEGNFPALVQRDAYIYLEISSNTIVSIDRSVLIYNSDKPFLDANKNLIYSNGGDNIYK